MSLGSAGSRVQAFRLKGPALEAQDSCLQAKDTLLDECDSVPGRSWQRQAPWVALLSWVCWQRAPCASLLQIKRWLHHLNGSASISEVLLATAINGKARGRGGPLEAVGSSGSSPPDEEEVDKELPQVVARLPLSIGFPIRFPVSCTRNRAFLDSRPGQQKDVETVKLFRPQKPSEVTVRA